MSHVYLDPDWEIADYCSYCLDETLIDSQTQEKFLIRGPQLSRIEKGNYFVCLGAAQTFGRFCEKPYPTLLQEMIELDVLNFGRGGAGPSFFLNLQSHEKFLEFLNNARFVIIQVLSGRSQENSLYATEGLGMYYKRTDGTRINANDAYRELLQTKDRKLIKKIVSETRNNWANNFQELLQEITAPKILFWFSERKPSYREKYTSLDKLWGAFPHLVNKKMVNRLRKYCDDYVECVTNRGKPHILVNRFTQTPTQVVEPSGQVWKKNNYYPTPEMHIDAANSLIESCKFYLNNPSVNKRFLNFKKIW